MTIDTNIHLEDGKYTIVLRSDGAMHALRHGEPWRDLVGDKMVMAMAHEILELRQVVPADGSVLQRADAWDAVWQQLNGLGAIDTATRGKTGKELARDALKSLADQARGQAGALEKARDEGHDGAIRYVLGYLNGVGDWGSTQYVEILNACGRERIIRSAIEDEELEFTGLGRWVVERGADEDRALLDEHKAAS